MHVSSIHFLHNFSKPDSSYYYDDPQTFVKSCRSHIIYSISSKKTQNDPAREGFQSKDTAVGVGGCQTHWIAWPSFQFGNLYCKGQRVAELVQEGTEQQHVPPQPTLSTSVEHREKPTSQHYSTQHACSPGFTAAHTIKNSYPKALPSSVTREFFQVSLQTRGKSLPIPSVF